VYTKLITAVIFLSLASAVIAHEQTPAYPKMKYSTVKNIVKYELSLFNQREEIKYFQIALYDQNFEGLPFSAKYRIMKVDYQTRKNFDVYIRKQDLGRAMYICTISKVAKGIRSKPFVQSMVCSKIKEETK
tara:strand:+ start:214 stop:606 length:393 start_codon:yes stop_codon:yes gene_type:complete